MRESSTCSMPCRNRWPTSRTNASTLDIRVRSGASRATRFGSAASQFATMGEVRANVAGSNVGADARDSSVSRLSAMNADV